MMSPLIPTAALVIAALTVACSPAADAPSNTPALETSRPDRPPEMVAEPLPLAVREWFQAARVDCETSGGTFSSTEDAGDYWQSGDFNGDRQPDFLLTRASLRCSNTEVFSGGSRGNTYELLVSQENGHVLTNEAILAREARVVQRSGMAIVLTPDSEDPLISHHWAWDGFKLAITGETDGPPGA